MEAELKEYLRKVHGETEESIARIEQNATEADLDVLRKGMQSWVELTGGKTLEQITQEHRQEQEAARAKAVKAAQREARERRRKRKSQFANGFLFIPILFVITMLFTSISDWVENKTAPTDLEEAFRTAEVYLEMGGISQSQLAEMMELEGCKPKEAEYIAENCDADWNEQAVLAARGHREYKSMSDDELLEMLIFQGFSEVQAAYGVENSK